MSQARATSRNPKAKERDILFSAPMVKSILNLHPGRELRPINEALPWKWQTRRRIDFSKMHENGRKLWDAMSFEERLWCLNDDPARLLGIDCPFGPPGRRLWVKENYWRDKREPENRIIYAATPDVARLKRGRRFVNYSAESVLKELMASPHWELRPSIFMWRWASRLDLQVLWIKAEIVQQISETDAIAEGVRYQGNWVDDVQAIADRARYGTINPEIQPHQAAYAHLWDELHGPDSWLMEPHWVWCVAFYRRMW